MLATGSAVVDGRGARRARRGHPWIERSSIVELDAPPGAVVRVTDRSGEFACWAACSPESWFPLRTVRRRDERPGEEYWIERIAAALARRDYEGGLSCARLINADADGLPGLTLDVYAGHLVVQASTAWADLNAGFVSEHVAQRVGAVSVLARNDLAVRSKEGLALDVRQLVGTTPEEITAECAGVRRFVDLWRGHKTGLYLDQQLNQRRAAGWLSGRLLDLFSGEGGFALPLAVAGNDVIAVDQAEAGLARGRRAAEASGVAGSVQWSRENAFDLLARLDAAGDRFDGAICDPPPFTRGRGRRREALKAYKDLHRRTLRLLRSGGRLLTFCCTFAVDAGEFESAVRTGAEEASASVRVLARPGQGPDHTEILELPESRYLKGLLLEVEASS